MVTPSPDFQRRITNTDNIVMAQKAHLVTGLYHKYPRDYIDLDLLNNLKVKRPWIEPIVWPIKDAELSKELKGSNKLAKLAITGGDKVLVMCVDFSDRPTSVPIAAIYNRFFGTSGNTFRNYFVENSYNMYVPDGIVVGNKWYRAPQTYSYYRDDPNIPGCDYGYKGTYPHNVQKLFEDVLDLINSDPSVTSATLSGLDIDGDDRLNRVIIVHAGGEAAYGGDCNDIWAVRWGIYPPKTIKGKIFSDFAMSAEYLNVPSDPQRSGIDCHEFSHILGIPDLYDYSDNTNGTGQWSLMSSGSWGYDYAITPSHLDAWSKYQFGWVTVITNPIGLTYMYSVETNNQIVKYTTLDPSEYFIVENRQMIGFDSYLPGSGLLIWHINEDKNQYTEKYCHTVSLVQADGEQDLEYPRNDGDPGDPYPGTTNNRSFGMYTIPSSLLCGTLQNGNMWDMLIDNISDSNYTMSFNSILSVGSVRFHTTPTGADIYFDTVYKGTTDINTGILGIDNIPVGTTNYTVKKVGHFDYIGSINISKNTITYKLVTMTQVAKATDMIAYPNACQSPCNTTVYVEWISNGAIPGSFYPAIKVNGQRKPFAVPEILETIYPGTPLIKNFTVSGLENGDYTICPDPN